MNFNSDKIALLSEYVGQVLYNDAFVDLTINRKKIRVEIADTHDSRSLGLMHRNELGRDSGMLFVFSSPNRQSFWMKDTHIPLSIAYIDEIGQILNIENMEPRALSQVLSTGPVSFALEMNKGWFDHNGIRSGDYIHGLSNCRSRQG